MVMVLVSLLTHPLFIYLVIHSCTVQQSSKTEIYIFIINIILVEDSPFHLKYSPISPREVHKKNDFMFFLYWCVI
jgi:hypothetical protein